MRSAIASASAANAGILVGQLAGGGQVLAGLAQLGGGLVDRRQLGEPAPDLARRRLVGVDRRVGEARLRARAYSVEQRGQPSAFDFACRHRFIRSWQLISPNITELILQCAKTAPDPARGWGGRRRDSYLPDLAFAYFCWNFATRPAVSSTRCLPV